MNRLNRKIEYALMALSYMVKDSKKGQLYTAKEICQVTGGPFDAIARVMQVMAQNGLLKSEQGAHGGYSLVRSLDEVTFFELAEMVVGPLNLVKCFQSPGDCELKASCGIVQPLALLNEKLKDFYASIPLSQLILSEVQTLNSMDPKDQVTQGAPL